MKVLIVVDMQIDFVTGSLGTREARAVVPNVVEKVRQYVKNEDMVILTHDTHWGDYLDSQEGAFLPIKHCIYGTKGYKSVPELRFILGYNKLRVCTKKTFGFEWGFRDRDFEEIEIVGLCTDICVISNALILKTECPETKITVDASCCAGTTPEKHKAALEVMKSCQIYIENEDKK